jgi:hypothetical protein
MHAGNNRRALRTRSRDTSSFRLRQGNTVWTLRLDRLLRRGTAGHFHAALGCGTDTCKPASAHRDRHLGACQCASRQTPGSLQVRTETGP